MINNVLSKITDHIDYDKSTQLVSYLNIYNYKILRKNREVLERIDHFTLDGIMLILFIRIFMGKKIKRKAPDFSSYFKDMFAHFEVKHKRIVFIGGSESEIEKFVEIVKYYYPKLDVVAFFNGFNIDEEQLIQKVISKKTDVVIIGMGTPLQELLMIKMKKMGFQGSCFTCGAFITQTAIGGKNYFPHLIDKLHLRWAFRIYKEPKLIKRYLLDYPVGLKYLILDKYKSEEN
ncbi:WecB/TagA/CpsF family glycosyltransferase [uncultured Eudoraea sp.]|uniref:WecB/TagA/CpsF family glycosyltransferase n=1 Tax=uncultured Eudoraea sp. TaxID=1035614 RepID=UPI0026317B41|nr:WecB/TagA/CpsF family glycosyltransferase [uncultured Eudoraea sp.]